TILAANPGQTMPRGARDERPPREPDTLSAPGGFMRLQVRSAERDRARGCPLWTAGLVAAVALRLLGCELIDNPDKRSTFLGAAATAAGGTSAASSGSATSATASTSTTGGGTDSGATSTTGGGTDNSSTSTGTATDSTSTGTTTDSGSTSAGA